MFQKFRLFKTASLDITVCFYNVLYEFKSLTFYSHALLSCPKRPGRNPLLHSPQGAEEHRTQGSNPTAPVEHVVSSSARARTSWTCVSKQTPSHTILPNPAAVVPVLHRDKWIWTFCTHSAQGVVTGKVICSSGTHGSSPWKPPTAPGQAGSSNHVCKVSLISPLHKNTILEY